MKKIILTIVAVLCAFSYTNVSAMTKDELKNKLTGEYTINGVTWKVEADRVAEIERYLTQNEVSESDADYIASKVDEAVRLIESGNATSYSQLSIREKDQLVALVNDVSNATSVKATVSKGILTVYNNDGTVFTKVTSIIKETGNTPYVLMLAGAVSVIGILTIARKAKKVNA